jgi:hypothetical protein
MLGFHRRGTRGRHRECVAVRLLDVAVDGFILRWAIKDMGIFGEVGHANGTGGFSGGRRYMTITSLIPSPSDLSALFNQ